MLPCSRLDEEIHRLLYEKERQGTLFFLRVHLGVLAVLLALSPLSAESSADLRPTLLLLTTLVGLVLFLHSWVQRCGSVLLSGALVLLCDAAAVSALPFVWIQAVGGLAVVPASYMLKAVTNGLGLFLLVVAALPVRPELPLLAGGALFASQSYFLLLALADPRSKFGTSYLHAVMGPEVNWLALLTQAVYIAMASALLALLTHRMRKAIIEGVRMEKASGQLALYISPEIARKIQDASSDFFRPGGRLQQAAVLFADIRDFTTLSENLPANDLLAFLADYQERMVRAIFEHGGTLDKFIGDGIMATFGTPEPRPDDAERAVRAGLSMKRELAALNRERQSHGLPPIRQGIGIHAGEVVAGNIGSADRLEYTVIGDAVNTASRIESACKEQNADFLISEAVYGCLTPDFRSRLHAEFAGEVLLKGKSDRLRIYRINANPETNASPETNANPETNAEPASSSA